MQQPAFHIHMYNCARLLWNTILFKSNFYNIENVINNTNSSYLQGADIIVFPEYGVIPIPMNSSKLMAFLEPIVFPSTRVLCNRPRPGMEIQVSRLIIQRTRVTIYRSMNSSQRMWVISTQLYSFVMRACNFIYSML